MPPGAAPASGLPHHEALRAVGVRHPARGDQDGAGGPRAGADAGASSRWSASPRSTARCSTRCSSLFGIVPDVDLDLMRPGQDLSDVTAALSLALREVLREVAARPRAGAGRHDDDVRRLARRVLPADPGRRTSRPACGPATCYSPWPEEANRTLIEPRSPRCTSRRPPARATTCCARG